MKATYSMYMTIVYKQKSYYIFHDVFSLEGTQSNDLAYFADVVW